MNIDLRREIKYNFKDYDLFHIKKFIILKYNLKKVYQDRYVNSIYFDTSNLKSANDNLTGLSRRKKFRIRWYNDDNFFRFEIKKKENKLSKKIIFEKNKFIKNKFYISDKIFKFLKQNKLSEICTIRYLRSYYMYKDLRITLDRNIVYKSLLNNPKNKIIRSYEKIIEIKFNNYIENSINLNHLTNNFSILSSRNSKYLNSLNYLGILNF
tara:strand:+ start:688 stop:1317 length:630 start_codon:yes stop_codon:yes gene_type:complete